MATESAGKPFEQLELTDQPLTPTAYTPETRTNEEIEKSVDRLVDLGLNQHTAVEREIGSKDNDIYLTPADEPNRGRKVSTRGYGRKTDGTLKRNVLNARGKRIADHPPSHIRPAGRIGM